MAIKFSRTDDGKFQIHDTLTGETRTYETQDEFLHASLVLLLQSFERMEAGIDRLLANFDGSARPAEPDQEIEVWP